MFGGGGSRYGGGGAEGRSEMAGRRMKLRWFSQC
jgi:hypothetical protein